MGDTAVVLVSGGLDSATALAWAVDRGLDCHALSFRYGQRHAVELDAAARVVADQERRSGIRMRHEVLDLDLGRLGGSSLTTADPVPRHRDAAEVVAAAAESIPTTYVPARNTVFLSLALAWAEVLGAADIVIGVNAVDYSGYPDCRPEFLRAFESVADLATRAAVQDGVRTTIHAPLVSLTKGEIVALGVSLGVDYSLTASCYDPDDTGGACGTCDSCLLRAAGFADAGVPDPTRYAGPALGGSPGGRG